MAVDSLDSSVAQSEKRGENNNIKSDKNDSELLGNPTTTMYSKATQDELQNIDLPLDDDTNVAKDNNDKPKNDDECNGNVSEGVERKVDEDRGESKIDTTGKLDSNSKTSSKDEDSKKELKPISDNAESIGIDQDEDQNKNDIAEEEDGKKDESKKADEDNDGKAMGIWDDADTGAADPLSNNDPTAADSQKIVQTIIINKVLTLRCIMCNAAIKFSCGSSTMSAGEKRAFKGKYRNHLLAEHNADDRYLGMEILVTKTFEIQFPNDDDKGANNNEEKGDERMNTSPSLRSSPSLRTSPSLNLLTPQVELKEGDPDDEDIIMDKQIPPRNNWRNYWRNNRFVAPNSMPPGLQVTLARNQNMMNPTQVLNPGFRQFGQFGQIGAGFRNPFQRAKNSEPITLDDEEDEDDSSSSSSSSGSDSESNSPTKPAPVEVVMEENKEKDTQEYFNELASKKKDSDESGLDLDTLPSKKKKKPETDSSDGDQLLLLTKKKTDSQESKLDNSTNKKKKTHDSLETDLGESPSKKTKKGDKGPNVSFSSSDKDTEKQDDPFQEAFKIAQEDLNADLPLSDDMTADLPLSDEPESKKDSKKEAEKESKNEPETDSKIEADKDCKKDTEKESDKTSEKMPVLPGIEIAPVPTNLPLPKDLEQQQKRLIPTINKVTGLPYGWRKETKRRRFGAPGFDIIIHNPKGRIFRSINELTKYCNKHPKRTMGINPRFVFSNIGLNAMSMPSQPMFHDPRGTIPIPKMLPLPPELGGTGELEEDDGDDDIECIDL